MSSILSSIERIPKCGVRGQRSKQQTGGGCERRSITPKETRTNPLTPNELRSKFEMLTAGIFSPKRQREASEAILGLGEEFTLSDLTKLLSNDVT